MCAQAASRRLLHSGAPRSPKSHSPPRQRATEGRWDPEGSSAPGPCGWCVVRRTLRPAETSSATTQGWPLALAPCLLSRVARRVVTILDARRASSCSSTEARRGSDGRARTDRMRSVAPLPVFRAAVQTDSHRLAMGSIDGFPRRRLDVDVVARVSGLAGIAPSSRGSSRAGRDHSGSDDAVSGSPSSNESPELAGGISGSSIRLGRRRTPVVVRRLRRSRASMNSGAP